MLYYNGTNGRWENGQTYNTSSTQWSRRNTDEVTLLDGAIANGFTFFNDGDKVTGGTTAYESYPSAGGADLEIAGTSGSITIEFTIGVTTYSYTENFDDGRTGTGQTRRLKLIDHIQVQQI
jgi:hypothetical protein